MDEGIDTGITEDTNSDSNSCDIHDLLQNLALEQR